LSVQSISLCGFIQPVVLLCILNSEVI
jgi:hypothetical protein